MRRNLALFVLFALAVPLVGCNEVVPSGHLGLRREPGDGFKGESILPPGHHWCSGRCVMHLIEAGDKQYELKMDVLCTDSLNFRFTVGILAAVNRDNPREITEAFGNLVPAGKMGSRPVITADQLFNTYTRKPAEEAARKAASAYSAREEIVPKRGEVIEKIRAAVLASVGTQGVFKVKRVTVGNLDFPDVITKAQEKAAEQEVKVLQTVAEARQKVAEEEGKLLAAAKRHQRKLVEAQSIADENRIIAGSITPQYLAYLQIGALKLAADGENNMFLVPYQDGVNKPVDTRRWVTQGVVDKALRDRVSEAQNAGNAALKKIEDAAEAKKVKAAPAPKAARPTLRVKLKQGGKNFVPDK